MFKGFKWVWEECSWEVANVKTFANPGFILPGLRYLFAVLKLLSFGGWINRRYRYFTSQELKDSGYLHIFFKMDIYVLCWIVLEFLAMFLVFRSPTVVQGSLLAVVLVVSSYRLLEIFQAWVNQYVLTYKWDPIDASRSLVFAFVGYWEITVIGAVVRMGTNHTGAWTNSLMTMILNPANEGALPIQYIQIMFAVLFAIVVVKQVVGRIAATDKES